MNHSLQAMPSQHPLYGASCWALNKEQSLRRANTTADFMVELVKLGDSWDLYYPTDQGLVPLHSVGEGGMIRMSLQGNKLERADGEKMDTVLQSIISQAIRDDPRIGCTWVVHCDKVPKYGFTLFAALDAEDQTFLKAHSDWNKFSTIALDQLVPVREEPKITSKHHDLSTKNKMPTSSAEVSGVKGVSGEQMLYNYQHQLGLLEIRANERLKRAKSPRT